MNATQQVILERMGMDCLFPVVEERPKGVIYVEADDGGEHPKRLEITPRGVVREMAANGDLAKDVRKVDGDINDPDEGPAALREMFRL